MISDILLVLGAGVLSTALRTVQIPAVFRIGTFAAPWPKGTAETVTFKYQTSTPNTVTATNLFADITSSGTRDCAVAKEGTAWFLIAAECP